MRKVRLCAILIALLAGCGDSTRFKVVPVEGKISFEGGQLLPAGTRLVFNPVEGKVGTATAATASDGTFTVRHASGRSGAEEGRYILLLKAPEPDKDGFYSLIPKEYYEGGMLSVEIKKGMAPLNLVVKR